MKEWKGLKEALPRWVEETVWLNGEENEAIDFFSLVSLSTALSLCVLLDWMHVKALHATGVACL